MHPKILERRGRVLSEKCAEIDGDIKAVSAAIARRVRLAGALCLGDEDADALERQFHESIYCVIELPVASEEGRRARRELIKKLMELDKYISFLLSSPWSKREVVSECQQSLDRCRLDLDKFGLS